MKLYAAVYSCLCPGHEPGLTTSLSFPSEYQASHSRQPIMFSEPGRLEHVTWSSINAVQNDVSPIQTRQLVAVQHNGASQLAKNTHFNITGNAFLNYFYSKKRKKEKTRAITQ